MRYACRSLYHLFRLAFYRHGGFQASQMAAIIVAVLLATSAAESSWQPRAAVIDGRLRPMNFDGCLHRGGPATGAARAILKIFGWHVNKIS